MLMPNFLCHNKDFHVLGRKYRGYILKVYMQ